MHERGSLKIMTKHQPPPPDCLNCGAKHQGGTGYYIGGQYRGCCSDECSKQLEDKLRKIWGSDEYQKASSTVIAAQAKMVVLEKSAYAKKDH